MGVLTLAVAAGFGPVQRVDQSVAQWGYRITSDRVGLSDLWLAVAAYGQPVVLRAVLLLLALFLAWRHRPSLATWLVAITIAENVAAPASKYLLRRPRPEWLDPIALERSLSYPSGHAAMVGTFTTAVVIVAFAAIRSGWIRRLVVLLALLVCAVISADRIFLGVHYLSDVIAGDLLGMSIVLAGWLVLLRFARARVDA